MQRYYFDTFNGVVIFDDEGVMMPDLASAQEEAKRLLAELVHRSAADKDETEFRADVRDETGRRVLTATLLLTLDRG
ncbi:DUF6894 family protein [Methylobacterium trifolii]